MSEDKEIRDSLSRSASARAAIIPIFGKISAALILMGMAASFACLAASPDFDKNKSSGSPTAPILVEVFSSFDCPHCREFHEQFAPALMKDYVTQGKVLLVNREFPLFGHPWAMQAANYATAAAHIGKYQQVADALFSQQAVWSKTGQVWPVVAGVLSAREQAQVRALVSDPSIASEVKRDIEEAKADKVDRTPSLIVSSGRNRYPIAGSPPYYLFKSLLDGLVRQSVHR